MVQLPAGHLRIGSIEMGQKGCVVKVPEARGVISHAIEGARQVVEVGDISVVALVIALQAQQEGGRTVRGGGAFSLPVLRWGVVGKRVNSVLTNVS